MKIKIQAAIGVSIVLVLVGSIVIFNSRSYSQNTEIITQTATTIETNTTYITRTLFTDVTNTDYLTEGTTSTTFPSAPFTIITTETATLTVSSLPQSNGPGYILAGGQNGTWFSDAQFPRLYQISLAGHSARKLNPVTGEGTVWSGDSNGTDWLISGWGNDAAGSPNPYLNVFNGDRSLNDSIEDAAEAEWKGGDVFAISSNGSSWLLSGMGSGILQSYSSIATNHLSAALFNGRVFTDLSSKLPEQMDGILYANAYNGTEWLIGGGYTSNGVLFSFNGISFKDLTAKIQASIPSFESVQSIAWNGKYWLIGGMGFLAIYDGANFVNLTPAVNKLVTSNFPGAFSINSIAWNGSEWLLGGGTPVAGYSLIGSAFLLAYNASSLSDLTPLLPSYLYNESGDSSILSIAPGSSPGSWVIAGYAGVNGLLLTYDGKSIADLSNLTGDMTYVDWVGVSG